MNQYNDAVRQIKTAILRSQAKALASVNQEQLALYYGIGRYISHNSRSGFWGKDAIETISRQLSAEMPGLRGFSPRNLRNMRMFYEQWKMFDTNLADASAKLGGNNNTLLPTILADIPVAAFFSIGFSHHVMILSKTKSLEERIFYIQLCADYLGQLSHYLHVLDDDERIEGENPPVGIVLCKDADKTLVEYVLQEYKRPMGVATYQAVQKKLMELLPDEEDMKKLMSS